MGHAQVGKAIRDVRRALGWSQHRLAGRIGMSQSWISRIERGMIDELSLASAERILGVMGARLVIDVDAPFLAGRARQREPAHASMSAHVLRSLRAAGWLVASEVEVGGDRSRGWIDVLACHPGSGLLLVIELKTEVHDLGAIQRSLGWYEREAWAAARRLGWRPRAVLGCLLLLATEANDERVAANGPTFAAEFPIRARALTEVVASGVRGPTPGRGLAMVDPRSRRVVWLRPSRADGRSSPAPYLDYADFMRSATRRGRGRTGRGRVGSGARRGS
jgi:transcriptional regulator with XRE-family HTH domain